MNTWSGAGVIGIKNNAVYTAAKHGVIGLTRAAALDYADAAGFMVGHALVVDGGQTII